MSSGRIFPLTCSLSSTPSRHPVSSPALSYMLYSAPHTPKPGASFSPAAKRQKMRNKIAGRQSRNAFLAICSVLYCTRTHNLGPVHMTAGEPRLLPSLCTHSLHSCGPSPDPSGQEDLGTHSGRITPPGCLLRSQGHHVLTRPHRGGTLDAKGPCHVPQKQKICDGSIFLHHVIAVALHQATSC